MTVRFDGKTIMGMADRGFSAAAGRAVPGLLNDEQDKTRAWIIWFFQHSSTALGMGVAVASATFLFGGQRLREELSRLTGPSLSRWSWVVLLCHLAALAAFAWLTEQIFEGPALSSTWVLAWLVAWVVSGLAVMVCLVATELPPGYWAPLARRGFRALVVGLVVGTAAAGAGQLTARSWEPLGYSTLASVHALLGLFVTDLVYQPSSFVIGTEAFAVSIAPQCSGYEGIGLVWAFLGAYLWFFRRRLRFPQAWLLLPLGAVFIWLANVVRIAALVAVGTWLSADVALGGFHSQAGWLGFLGVALGLIFLAQKCRWFHRDQVSPTEPTAGPSREAVYLAPLLAVVAVAMVGGAFSTGGLDRYYPARLAAVAVPLWLYRREYTAMRWACSWQAQAIRDLVFANWVALWPNSENGFVETTTQATNAKFGWMSVWLLARVVGSVATVPLAEELAFRGFLTRRLIASDFDTVLPGRFTWTSFAVSSVAFGVLHDRWLEGTMAGMLYALAYYRRGSLGDAVAAHATTNVLLSADAVMTGDWTLFS